MSPEGDIIKEFQQREKGHLDNAMARKCSFSNSGFSDRQLAKAECSSGEKSSHP
jgi:hypothetical protein